MNKDPGVYDQFQKQTHSNGLVPGISERNNNSLGQSSREVVSNGLDPAQSHKIPGGVNQCVHSKDGNARANGNSGSSWRIEFGSIGDLADKLISKSETCSEAIVEPTSTTSHGEKRLVGECQNPFTIPFFCHVKQH